MIITVIVLAIIAAAVEHFAGAMTGLILAVLICGLGPTSVAFGLSLALGPEGFLTLVVVVIAACMAEARLAREKAAPG